MIVKKSLLLLLFLTVSRLFLLAETKDVERYVPAPCKAEQIVLECPIGEAYFLNPRAVEAIGDAEITGVHYVFTSYHKGAFVQRELDEKRMQQLVRSLGREDVPEPEFYRQNSCQERDCAARQLHGFVINYVPKGLFKPTNLERQYFQYDTRSGKQFVTEAGMEVTIPSLSLATLDGLIVEGIVDVAVREALTIEDMVVGGLITQTDEGEMLQSGGMFEIRLSQYGRSLEFRSGSSMDIIVPADNRLDGMELFAGSDVGGRLLWRNPVPLNIDTADRSSDIIETLESEYIDEVAVAAEAALIDMAYSESAQPFYYGGDISWSGSLVPDENGRITDQIVWYRGKKISRIMLTQDGVKTEFADSTYEVTKGVEAGLTNTQASALCDWFTTSEVLTPLEVSKVFNPSSVVGNGQGYRPSRSFDALKVRNRPDSSTFSANTFQVNRPTSLANYAVRTNRLEWCNIDRLAKKRLPNRGALLVELSEALPHDEARTEVMLIMPDQNVSISGRFNGSNGLVDFTGRLKGAGLPMKNGAKAYVLTSQMGVDYRFCLKEITMGERTLEKVELLSTDEEEALAEIRRVL